MFSLHKIGIIKQIQGSALSFLEPKTWNETSHSTKNAKTTASFTHNLKREKNLANYIDK